MTETDSTYLIVSRGKGGWSYGVDPTYNPDHTHVDRIGGAQVEISTHERGVLVKKDGFVNIFPAVVLDNNDPRFVKRLLVRVPRRENILLFSDIANGDSSASDFIKESYERALKEMGYGRDKISFKEWVMGAVGYYRHFYGREFVESLNELKPELPVFLKLHHS